MYRHLSKFIILILLLHFVSSCQYDLKKDTEDVWQTVEKRMTTWKERDKIGQLELYHPDFRRWMSDTLFNKKTFLNDWELVDSRIVEINIEKIELQFITHSNLSVAHYKVNETLEWIGDDLREDDFTIVSGETWTENYTVSDYYVKEKNEWLYIGGSVKLLI
jgi:hypothetical protein